MISVYGKYHLLDIIHHRLRKMSITPQCPRCINDVITMYNPLFQCDDGSALVTCIACHCDFWCFLPSNIRQDIYIHGKHIVRRPVNIKHPDSLRVRYSESVNAGPDTEDTPPQSTDE